MAGASGAAALMGSWAKREALQFDRIVASPAARVKDTFGKFMESYGAAPEPVWDKRVYLASAATIADVIAEADDADESVLVVGHNPGLEEFILDHVADDGGNRGCAMMSPRNSRRLPLRCSIFRSSIGGNWRMALSEPAGCGGSSGRAISIPRWGRSGFRALPED